MSCHYIGKGMNSVGRVLDGLYGEGRIGEDEMRILMRALKKGVYWCDGNGYEAMAWFYEKRCACCLGEVVDDSAVYDVRECIAYDQWGQIEERLLYELVCEDCLESLLLEIGVEEADLPECKEKARAGKGARDWARSLNNWMF